MSTATSIEAEHRTAEKALAWFLRIGGACLLLAFAAALLPVGWMDAIHRRAGLGDLPRAPIVEYLARSASLLYGFHGAILVYLGLDPRRHAPLIAYIGWLTAGFGAAILAIDLAARMPLPWTACEGPPVILAAAAMVFLARRIAQH